MPDCAINIRARKPGGWRVTACVTDRRNPVYRNDRLADLPAAAGVVADPVTPAPPEADRQGERK